MQARLADVLGLKNRRNSVVSLESISSFAGSVNTKQAYKNFCKSLYRIGVTAELISQKEREILNIFKPHKTAVSGQTDDRNFTGQRQLPTVSDFSGVEIRPILMELSSLGPAMFSYRRIF